LFINVRVPNAVLFAPVALKYIELKPSFRKNGNKEEIAISMFSHSNVYGQAGKYHVSNTYLDTTLNIAIEIDFALMQQKVYKAYARNYNSLGNFELH